MITKPILPPKVGYVEVVENGVHVYKPTAETLAAQQLEKENRELREALNTLLGTE